MDKIHQHNSHQNDGESAFINVLMEIMDYENDYKEWYRINTQKNGIGKIVSKADQKDPRQADLNW